MELFSSLMVSTIGVAFFTYGKKQQRPPQLILGMVLVVVSYFISGIWPLWFTTAGLVFLTWALVKMGL